MELTAKITGLSLEEIKAGPSSRGLGHIPFKDATRVRIPQGPPNILHYFRTIFMNSKLT